jgi:hypothetical protein
MSDRTQQKAHKDAILSTDWVLTYLTQSSKSHTCFYLVHFCVGSQTNIGCHRRTILCEHKAIFILSETWNRSVLLGTTVFHLRRVTWSGYLRRASEKRSYKLWWENGHRKCRQLPCGTQPLLIYILFLHTLWRYLVIICAQLPSPVFYYNSLRRGVQVLLSIVGQMAENLCMCSSVRGDEPSASIKCTIFLC